MTYVKVDVPKSTIPNVGRGGDKKDIIRIFDWDDVATKTRADNICSGLAFKAGAYMLKVYVTMDTIKVNVDSSGAFDTQGVSHQVDFSVPGGLTVVRDLRSNWINRKCGIIIEKVSDGSKLLYGDDGAPLALTFKEEWDKDKNITTFTFKSICDGPEVADYTSTYTDSTSPAGTAAANATTVDFSNGQGNYQLTTGSASAAAITAFTATPNPIEGGVYTLLGSGGTYPSTIATSTTIILKGGVTWTASAAAQLTLKCFKDGPSSYKFYEINRV